MSNNILYNLKHIINHLLLKSFKPKFTGELTLKYSANSNTFYERGKRKESQIWIKGQEALHVSFVDPLYNI